VYNEEKVKRIDSDIQAWVLRQNETVQANITGSGATDYTVYVLVFAKHENGNFPHSYLIIYDLILIYLQIALFHTGHYKLVVYITTTSFSK
jgi:hypothetical protein